MANSHPFVPAVAVEEFTCAGSGLLYENHPRESPADLRSLLLPTGDRNGIGDRDRPQKWWLAQNKFYDLAQAKATPIGTLRSKLEDALRSPGGMRVSEKILNLEAEGNRKYNELLEHVLKETQVSKKGAGKPSKATAMPPKKTSNPGPPKASTSASKGKGAAKRPIGKSTTTTGGGSSSNSGPPGRSAKATAKNTPKKEPSSSIPSIKADDLGIKLPPRYHQRIEEPSPPPPRKRSRSPDEFDGMFSSKRVRPDDDITEFGFLVGTYKISAPQISGEWSHVGNNFQLVIRLDSEKRLFGAFQLGIFSGVLRSLGDIQSRKDGASARFEWCGREEYGGSEVYTPGPEMKGVLQFTKRKRDGRHTIKGSMEAVRGVGKCDFTGEMVGGLTRIWRDWEDFNQDAYDEANRGRWRR